MLQQQKCLATTNAQQYHNEQKQHPSADANDVRCRAISLPQHVASERELQQQRAANLVDRQRAAAAWITASAAKQRQQHAAATLAAPTLHKHNRNSAGWNWNCTRTRDNVPDVAATLAPTHADQRSEINDQRATPAAAAAQSQSQIAQVATDDRRNVEWHRTASDMLPPTSPMLSERAAKATIMFGLKVVNTLDADVRISAAQFVAGTALSTYAHGGHMQNHNNNNNNNNTAAYSSHNHNSNNNNNNNNHNKSSKNNCNNLCSHENTEKTIDFNSRRRRGRLRFVAGRAHVAATCVRNVVSYASALLLLLLSLIVGYVNMIASLVITQTTAATERRKNSADNANGGNRKHNNNNCKSNSNSKNPKVQHACFTENANLPNANPPAVKAAAALTGATKIDDSIGQFRRRRGTKLSAATVAFNSGGHMQLIYAFILCTSILLPCGHNLVAAAKPKSATQLQQQKQQHDLLQLQQQQQQQHQHQQHHHPGQAGQQLQPQSHQPDGIDMAYDGVSGGVLTPPSYQVISSQTSNEESELLYASSQSEERFDEEEQNLNDLDEEAENAAYETQANDTNHVNVTKTPLFPKDLFTKEQLENGAVACHIIGVIYMFVALAIVCDEFFVPSLDVIIEKLDITDDVAGATFMAAGGSAPELFTSVIGVFISFDDVGIGTIVGSAVFNILFVIGMCALFSKTVLTLTWWPLFRDCSFYSISLLVLIYFFRDNFIFWWEALILFSIYIAYVAFMKWNVQVERCVKKVITKNKVTRVRSTDQLMPAGNAANSSETSMATQPGGSVTSRAASETRSGPPGSSSGGAGATGNSSGTAGSTHTGAKFRHGLLQLMIHTIDPLHDDDVPGKVDEKATQLHAIASLKVLLDATKPQRGGATTSAANHVKINLKETTLADRPNGNIDTTLDSADVIEDEPEPLSMAWPDTARKRLTYVLVAPLLIPMWLTLPDTRTPRGKKYFPITFIGSILWIAAFSYLMVWWANVAGDTARIPPEVMGLTFLAAGTSIPDLITSVIVARKGFGDMAVSSSVGSNIFDVTVGLPIPWLIYGIIYGAPVEVNSVGMVCSITILFMMLVFVVMSIACFRWRMNKGLGFTMFLLYFVFVAVSLMFEYDMISCPV